MADAETNLVTILEPPHIRGRERLPSMALETDFVVRRRTVPPWFLPRLTVPNVYWQDRREFFLGVLAFSVGLGSIWRFPTVAYFFGGGTFLVPFVIFMILFGNPLMFFEAAMGQFTNKGPIRVFSLCPLFQGLGWSMTVYCLIFIVYYNAVITFAVFYIFSSLLPILPWAQCSSTSNADGLCNKTMNGSVSPGQLFYQKRDIARLLPDKQTPCAWWAQSLACQSYELRKVLTFMFSSVQYIFLKLSKNIYDTNLGSLSDGLGPIRIPIVSSLFIVWCFLFGMLMIGIHKHIKFRFVWIPMFYALMIVLLGATLMQEGAADGLSLLFIPSFYGILRIEVWIGALEQCLFMLGVGMGPLIYLASFSHFKSPSHHDVSFVMVTSLFTSLLSGSLVYSTIGVLAHRHGITPIDVLKEGPGMVFMIYPEAFNYTFSPRMLSFLFFVFLTIAGLDTVHIVCETVRSTLLEVFPKLVKFHVEVTVTMSIIFFLLGLPLVCQHGMTLVLMLDKYGMTKTLVPISIMEIIANVYIYSMTELCDDIELMLGSTPNVYYRFCWSIYPVIAGVLLVHRIVTGHYYDETTVKCLGWLTVITILLPTVCVAFRNMIRYYKLGDVSRVLRPQASNSDEFMHIRTGRRMSQTGYSLRAADSHYTLPTPPNS